MQVDMHCFTLAILLQKGSCSDVLQNGTRLCMSDFSFVKFLFCYVLLSFCLVFSFVIDMIPQ